MTTTIIIALLVTILVVIGWKLMQVQRTAAPSAGTLPVARAASPVSGEVLEDPIEPTLREMIARDDLLGAGRLLMQERQLDMEEAHEVVNVLRAQQPLPASPRLLAGAQVAASPEFQRLIADDQLMEAIKYYRAATGCGLKEAKEAMDKAVADRRK